jgi:hypothetical protein
MARSVECKCESNFTCGYCLRNAKPYHFTCDNGTVIMGAPGDLQRSAARDDREAQQALSEQEQARQ